MNDMFSNKCLNVAFLGGGINSAIGNTHKIALEMDQNFKLIAGCFSRNNKINLQSAIYYGLKPDSAYSSLKDLIKEKKYELDAIIILTPTPEHKKDILECINNDIAVISDKALVSSVEDAIEIKNVLIKKNGFLAVTYNYTGYPMLRELKSLITDNKIGKIQLIQIEMPQESFLKHSLDDMPCYPQEWRLKDYKIPTISLDLGVHIENIIHYLTGEKALSVMATQNNYGNFEGIIDDISCIAKYTNNITCNIWYSKVALGESNGLRIRVYGSLGSVYWYQMEPEVLILNNDKGQKNILQRSDLNTKVASEVRYNRFKAGHPSGFIEAFANHYMDISVSLSMYLKTGKQKYFENVFGIDDAINGLKMLETISSSECLNKI